MLSAMTRGFAGGDAVFRDASLQIYSRNKTLVCNFYLLITFDHHVKSFESHDLDNICQSQDYLLYK